MAPTHKPADDKSISIDFVFIIFPSMVDDFFQAKGCPLLCRRFLNKHTNAKDTHTNRSDTNSKKQALHNRKGATTNTAAGVMNWLFQAKKPLRVEQLKFTIHSQTIQRLTRNSSDFYYSVVIAQQVQ
ncbi:hypothetical protein [Cellvibrio sp. KY-YJ-3]|uniref:hypothetical protein n=1 Tax=Cellvibrio sp. KY-YJ-3 TaxID=454662 RepID=UPI001CDA460F